MRRAVVVVLGIAACGDDLSLRVDVEHPIAVATTTITVYEPEDFDCHAVRYGDATEAALATARVAEVTNAEANRGAALGNLSRTAAKVIVARGYDADGTLATAGCEDKGLIGDHDRVTIITDRAALASIGPLLLGGATPYSLTVALTDPRGSSLPRNRLSWRVYGPSGSTDAPAPNDVLPVPGPSGVWELAAPACVNNQGTTTIHPVPPSTVGGFAIEVRPAWPIERPPLVTAFTRLAPALYATVPAPIRHPCAIRAAQGASGVETSILCVELTTPSTPPLVGREYRVTVGTDGQVSISPMREHLVPPQTIALLSVPRGGNLRDVYAVTAGGFVAGIASPSIMPAPLLSQAGLSDGTASDALLLPDCGLGATPRILLRVETASNRKIVVKDLAGAALETDYHGISFPLAQAVTIRATGCMTELDPRDIPLVRQSAVFDMPARSGPVRQITSAYFECILPAAQKHRCFIDLPVNRAGAGYFPGATPGVSGANVDASGLVVSTWSALLQLETLDYLRAEFDRTPAASLPLHIVYGHFDGDDKHDAFWDVTNLDQTDSAFQITYAQMAGTTALSALTASEPLAVQELLVGDVTSDGKDDVVIVGTGDPTTTPVFGLLVMPSQVAAPPVELRGVDTCP